MFNYLFKYTNNRNEVFEFGSKTGLYLDESELFDYSWDVEASQGKITSILREPHEIPVSLLFLASSKDAGIINDFDTITDYDVRIGKPGKLELNGYTLDGLFIRSEASDYAWKKGYMRRDMSFFTTSKDWYRVNKFSIQNFGARPTTGKGYPHAFAHSYTNTGSSGSINNTSPFPCEFVMSIYGPCSDPYVVIGDNTYQLDLTLGRFERVVIDSTDHTKVLKYSMYGDTTNVFDSVVFGAPGSGQYIFEPIAPGTNVLSLPIDLLVNLDIIEPRSTPRWYENDTKPESGDTAIGTAGDDVTHITW